MAYQTKLKKELNISIYEHIINFESTVLLLSKKSNICSPIENFYLKNNNNTNHDHLSFYINNSSRA